MTRIKAVLILLIIIASLLPVHWLYQYLHRRMQPRLSGRRFLLWLGANLLMIFVYTFLVVFVVKLLFPKA